MRSRARLAALKVLALREEFNNRELRKAVSLAREYSTVLLSRNQLPKSQRGRPSQSARRSKPALAKSESRVVKSLRVRDPDRYSLLSKIDQAMRAGDVLPRLSNIKDEGRSLDRDFNGGKSRRLAIPRLMAKLTALPLKEVERLYESWKQKARDDRQRGTEYDELAEFLITGTANPTRKQ